MFLEIYIANLSRHTCLIYALFNRIILANDLPFGSSHCSSFSWKSLSKCFERTSLLALLRSSLINSDIKCNKHHLSCGQAFVQAITFPISWAALMHVNWQQFLFQVSCNSNCNRSTLLSFIVSVKVLVLNTIPRAVCWSDITFNHLILSHSWWQEGCLYLTWTTEPYMNRFDTTCY